MRTPIVRYLDTMNLAKNQAKISMDDPLETLNDDCLSVLSKGIITDGSDDGDERTHRTEEINVDLSINNTLVVDISDALSERDKVKYTVHTKTTMLEFAKCEMSVVREHEEFIWLHSCLEDNEAYAGFIVRFPSFMRIQTMDILDLFFLKNVSNKACYSDLLSWTAFTRIPPSPPRPDFDASREKLQRLGENEATMTKEEFLKTKQELEQEYLATFKKTVAMHEVFLCRLAAHPIFRQDPNFRIFLEYDQELCVRGKNKKELMGSLWKRFTQSADEVLLSGQKDVDDFFDHERNYLVEYYAHIKDATSKSDRIARLRKSLFL
ncbi:unnamed protein product [Dracunculus medinensis]|uniref:PX domain-containing protein n=1 Tax=Dracunculus medinensis TaxID=318479 RepID=A0A0N4UM38_DRAME|nr:unnamed protein product [Dracunculus medinensis]